MAPATPIRLSVPHCGAVITPSSYLQGKAEIRMRPSGAALN